MGYTKLSYTNKILLSYPIYHLLLNQKKVIINICYKKKEEGITQHYDGERKILGTKIILVRE